ncbi:MAG: class I SAM-dependent methyltransferase [Hyphomonas sp.]
MTRSPPPRCRCLAGMQAFIEANTRLLPVPGLAAAGTPLRLWQAAAIPPIWSATETDLSQQGIEPPFWAFAWAGGQAIARLILEQPGIVEGKRVLDIACGSGLIAVAAARAGAADVAANDIDPLCEAAVALNAAANGVTVTWRGGDLLDGPGPDVDVIMAGDVFYQRQMAERFTAWLSQAAARGAAVYAGDPGRAYAPVSLAPPIAEYDIDTLPDLESAVSRRTRVWTF